MPATTTSETKARDLEMAPSAVDVVQGARVSTSNTSKAARYACISTVAVAVCAACGGAAYLGARFGQQDAAKAANERLRRTIAFCEDSPHCDLTYADVDAALHTYEKKFDRTAKVQTAQVDQPVIVTPEDQDPDEVHDEIVGRPDNNGEPNAELAQTGGPTTESGGADAAEAGAVEMGGAGGPGGNQTANRTTGFKTFELKGIDPDANNGGTGGAGGGATESGMGHFIETTYDSDEAALDEILNDLPDTADAEEATAFLSGGGAFGPQRRSLKIMGPDGRSERSCDVARNDPRYKPIVKLERRDSSGSMWGCTGTLIGRNTILTAAHCVHAGDGKTWKWPTGVRLGACEGRQGTHYTPYMLVAFTKYVTSQDANYDIAMIKVHGNPGDTWGYQGFGYSTNDLSNIYAQAAITGYPCDRSWYDMWGMSGPSSVNGKMIEYTTLDTYGCQSGSGMKSPNWNNIIMGVHAYGWTNVKNYGPKIRSEVFWPILRYSRYM